MAPSCGPAHPPLERQHVDGPPANDWSDLLAHLERRLERLVHDGVRWLNIAPHGELADLLERYGAALNAAPGNQAPGNQVPCTPESSARGNGADAPAKLEAPAEPEAPADREDAILEVGADRPAGTPQPEQGREPPHPSAIATLESLRFQYRACLACGLGHTRSNLVFGTGAQRPRLMFIGEGPGAEEDQQGLPFVGRAGTLLTGFIKALGLTREDVYITNVVKCRPPGNRNPQGEEITACRPILQRQAELLRPALIVTLGNVPLKVFKPHAGGITRERGQPFISGEQRVLPTFHPSYLLRNPAAIAECWADFRQAREIAYPSP